MKPFSTTLSKEKEKILNQEIKPKQTLLIVVADKAMRNGLRSDLGNHFEVCWAEDATTALTMAQESHFLAMLADFRLPQGDAVTLIRQVKSLALPPVCILMTAFGLEELAGVAMRQGADDCIAISPLQVDELELRIHRILRQRELEVENVSLKQQLDSKFGLEKIITASPAMKEALDTIRQVAPTGATILLLGESGTGKEFMARAIHRLSPRAPRPIVSVHCAALASTFLESELFGHEKGAFAGAHEMQIGSFEQAHGGTLFLDEIDEIDAAVQAKVLRVLDKRSFERVGSNKILSADVRVIAAANKDLAGEVRAGRFREDLYFRLRLVEVTLPALRDRAEDIPLLARSFLHEYAAEKSKPAKDFTPVCLEALINYKWPGNIYELRAAVESAVARSVDERIHVRELPVTVLAASPHLTDSSAAPETEVSVEDPRPQFVARLTMRDRIQRFMWGLSQLEGGPGPKMLKISAAVIAFALVAFWFNTHRLGFSNPEAMESAHLGRQLAEWKGYTTESIRPAALGLLQRADPGHAADVLQNPVPDLSIAPGYPFLLACLMKVLPFNYTTNRIHPWFYQPELLITLFNEGLFFAAVVVLFQMARRLFDSSVAWVAAITFAGSETYWRFSVSGLSTMWLLLIFLFLAWCLMALEKRERPRDPPSPGPSLTLAATAGGLVGLGALTRYSFGFVLIPVLLFMGFFFPRNRMKLLATAGMTFFLVIGPWITRNLILSHTPFGTAGYALLQDTRSSEEDRVERAFDPAATSLKIVTGRNVVNKFFVNEEKILRNDLPQLGGNWVWCFFLCGLLLPFRHGALRRLRWLLVWALALTTIVQALGQTYLSVDSPEINSENLLALMAPLVLIFGAGFFFTLLDQTALPHRRLRKPVAGLFTVAMCAPLLLELASPQDNSDFSPYAPYQVQKTAMMMEPDELMMSDIPWAVAWYGDRSCAWLTLDDGASFDHMSDLKAVQSIYLTQRTTARPFLSTALDKKQGWGRFLLDSLPPSESPQGVVPIGFPLTKASPGYPPFQMFLSDSVRWNTPAKK